MCHSVLCSKDQEAKGFFYDWGRSRAILTVDVEMIEAQLPISLPSTYPGAFPSSAKAARPKVPRPSQAAEGLYPACPRALPALGISIRGLHHVLVCLLEGSKAHSLAWPSFPASCLQVRPRPGASKQPRLIPGILFQLTGGPCSKLCWAVSMWPRAWSSSAPRAVRGRLPTPSWPQQPVGTSRSRACAEAIALPNGTHETD